MAAQVVQSRGCEFKFFIGLYGYNTVGLANEIAVVVCEAQAHLLLTACNIEQGNFEKVSRFLEILVGLGFEGGIGLGNHGYNHLGKVHILGIEVGLSATKHSTHLAVFIFYGNVLE